MAVTLNASTSAGLVQSADLSGSLNIQSNGTTVLGVTSTGTSVTGTQSVSGAQSVSGNLSFNSGYGSSAVAYGCRAWVNFNGTGTPAIRSSGNVTSITDNGTGDYTINITTAMPDVNYAVAGTCNIGTSNYNLVISPNYGANPTTSAFRFVTSANDGNFYDCAFVYIAVFRQEI